MKTSSSLRAPALLLLCFCLPLITSAQGRPDIHWMRGGHSDLVFDMKFTPDGQNLVTSGMDGTVKVFRVSDGVLLRTFVKPDGRILDLGSGTIAISPDGLTLAIGDFVSTPSKATLVYLYNLSDGALQRTSSGFTPVCGVVCDYAARLSFSADGSNLLVTKDIVRVSDGVILRTMPSGLSGYSYSPDGSRILAYDSGGAEEINPNTFATIRSLNNNSVTHYSPNGLYAYSDNGFSVKRLSDLSDITLTDGNLNGMAAFSPDGQYFADSSYGDNSGTASQVRVWQVSNSSTTWPLAYQFQPESPSGNREILAFSSDSQYLVTGKKVISLWNSSGGTFARNISVLGSGAVEGLAFSSDGQTLVGTGHDGTVRIWRVSDGTPLQTYDQET